MKTITDYMNELAKKYGSFYAVAQEMGITQASISVIRKGGGVKDETALKIAELLQEDESEVLLAAAISRSKGHVRTAWENVSKRAGLAASIALAAVMTQGIDDANAETSLTPKATQTELSIIYIMRSQGVG